MNPHSFDDDFDATLAWRRPRTERDDQFDEAPIGPIGVPRRAADERPDVVGGVIGGVAGTRRGLARTRTDVRTVARGLHTLVGRAGASASDDDPVTEARARLRRLRDGV